MKTKLILVFIFISLFGYAQNNCASSDLITEYRIGGNWLSGQSSITVNAGDNIMLSGLPNSKIITITDPNGQIHPDNYQLNGIGLTQSGTYIINSQEGCSVSLTVIVNDGLDIDTQAPTSPTISSTSKTETTVALSWSGATDNTAITGYKVFKEGVLEATLGNVSSYPATGLNANTNYSFTVSALDAAGNESVFSNAIAVTTDALVVPSNLLDTSTWILEELQDLIYEVQMLKILEKWELVLT